MSVQAILFVVLTAMFGIAMVTRRLKRGPISATMIVTGIAVTVAAFEPNASAMIPHSVIEYVATATLGLILFADAVELRFRAQHMPVIRRVTVRLLLIGMPLSILLGAGLARVLWPDLSWVAALTLAVVLAPTDAALSQPVFDEDGLPEAVQMGLDAESGLNDGLGFPLLLWLIGWAGLDHGVPQLGHWLPTITAQILLGPLVGALVGSLGAAMLVIAESRAWIDETWHAITVLLLAGLAYTGAELVYGNGFLAVFVGGLFFGRLAPQAMARSPVSFAAEEGQLLIQATFFLFGLTAVFETAPQWSWAIVTYAMLSLTVVRVGPVALAMWGLSLPTGSRLFMGWFGPRGIASVIYLRLVDESHAFESSEVLLHAATATIALSIVLHGATAHGGVRWYRSRIARGPDRNEVSQNEQNVR